MADPIKRVNYFDHQFLRVEDFACEQEYHVARRRLHNRLLHTPGIAQGLEVEYKQRASKVTIRPGTAVDSEGREIVLVEERDQPLPDWKESQEYWLTIAYHEQTTDATDETGVKGDTRWMETPVIEWSTVPEQEVVLAYVRRSDDKVTVDSSENVRTVAGAKLGDTTARKLAFTHGDVDASQWPALSCGAANRVDLAGSLTVTGNVGLGTTEPGHKLEIHGDDASLVLLSTKKTGNDRNVGLELRTTAEDGVSYIDFTKGSKSSVGVGTPDYSGRISYNQANTGAFAISGGHVGIGMTEPKSPLTVNGNIGLGPNASLYAPGGVENLNLIRGTVAPDGSALGGLGFSVDHSGLGLYNITFSQAFSAKPTVVVTQQFPDSDDFNSGGGATTDNCVVVAVSNTGCRIKSGGGDGKPSDRRFHFVAIGPRQE